jgi:hypothetical protein
VAQQATVHHVILVRNGNGKIVHTHEVILFDGAAPLTEQELLDAAIGAATSHHPDVGDLTPSISTKEELERLHAEHPAARLS